VNGFKSRGSGSKNLSTFKIKFPNTNGSMQRVIQVTRPKNKPQLHTVLLVSGCGIWRWRRPFKDFAHSIRCPVVQREVCSYLNLQLLTERANLEKGGKYTAEDAAASKSSEAGIKLAAKRLQWIAEGVCPGCEYCKE